MSWSEVAKLQEGQRDRLFNDMYILETSQTWTAPHNGYYKIICVGAGGSASTIDDRAGCGGGVAVKTKRMNKGTTLAISITGGATCDGMTATSGGNAYGSGGTATGGDYNYTGLNPSADTERITAGGSVGCYLTGLTYREKDMFSFGSSTIFSMPKGFGIMGHGGGGGYFSTSGTTKTEYAANGEPACVIIIPLESI